MKQIKVRVTRKHIKGGVQKNCARCPIALALRDVFPEGSVSVSKVDGTVGETHFSLSARAQKFIAAFDSGRKVKPATFIFKIDD